MFFLFLSYCYCAHRDLHSFPTRRSSDLGSPRSTSLPAGWLRRPLRRPYGSSFARESARLHTVTRGRSTVTDPRSEEHTSELQSHSDLVCRLLLEKKKKEIRLTNTHTDAD